MRHRTAIATAVLALAVLAAAGPALAQAAFKVPFPLKAAGKSLAAGEYTVAKAPDGGLVLKQVSSGKETPLAVLERLPQPAPPAAEPRLVFDEVGDFAPSYTEYITVYVLAEAADEVNGVLECVHGFWVLVPIAIGIVIL